MSGTRAGGLKTANTVKKLYGEDYFQTIGVAGGKKSRGGGWASNKIGKDSLTGRERAIVMGSKGGKKSKRRVHEDRMV